MAVFFVKSNVENDVMACSKPLDFSKVYEITSSNARLLDFLRINNLLFSFDGLCDRCAYGLLRLVQDSSAADGLKWRCTNRRCNYKLSLRKLSFFSSSKLPLSTITAIIYYWTYKYPQEIVIHETGLSNHTVFDFYNFLCEVCCVILQEQSEPVGGPDKIVEIDESKFRKSRYIRGVGVNSAWVFGGIERDSNPPKCFFVPVSDRSAATLLPVITHWILPGTTVLSEFWKAYSSREKEDFIHHTVNHGLHFIAESGIHKNNIESRLKKSLPKHSTAEQHNCSHFAEYCVRTKFIDSANDKFLEVLRLISLVYNPCRANETDVNHCAQHEELLPQCPDTASATAALPVDNSDVDDVKHLLPSSFDLRSDTGDHDSNVDMCE